MTRTDFALAELDDESTCSICGKDLDRERFKCGRLSLTALASHMLIFTYSVQVSHARNSISVEHIIGARYIVFAAARSSPVAAPLTKIPLRLYSQVHEIHPSHAFVAVPDKEATIPQPLIVNPDEEKCESPPLVLLLHIMTFWSRPNPFLAAMTHPGVRCDQCVPSLCLLSPQALTVPTGNSCLQDIVGARFHCAQCDDVDICANCESAGLPGNLTSPDGGHDSSHIMIKVGGLTV